MERNVLKTLKEMQAALERLESGDPNDIRDIVRLLLEDRIADCKDALDAF